MKVSISVAVVIGYCTDQHERNINGDLHDGLHRIKVASLQACYLPSISWMRPVLVEDYVTIGADENGLDDIRVRQLCLKLQK